MKIIITLSSDTIVTRYDIRIEAQNPTLILDSIDMIKLIKKKMKELCME